MITRTFNNQTTFGTVAEGKLEQQAMIWSQYDPLTTKNINLYFRFISGGFGLAVDVLCQVVLEDVIIGEFSTQSDRTLQDILDSQDYSTVNNCEVVVSDYVSPYINSFEN
jgi:hypothetical protein